MIKYLEDDNIKRNVNIEINNGNIMISILKKKRKGVLIEKSVVKNITFDNTGNQNKEEQDAYLKNISEVIDEELKDYKNISKNISYNIQTDKIIIRNIETANIKRKKDILKLIELEITQYIPINIEQYIIKYRIINVDSKNSRIQVILFPRSIVDMCKSLSEKLKMKPKSLNVNFDVLQKVIDKNLVDDFHGNGVFIECRDREFIINIVKNHDVYESYAFIRNIQSYETAINIAQDLNDVYYYGVEDPFMKRYFETKFKIQPLKLRMKVLYSNKELDFNNENSKYINSIGMII